MTDNSLRDIRLRLNLTQKDLAVRAGITRSAVLRSEQLIPHSPPVGLVNALSGLTERSTDQLNKLYAIDRQAMLFKNMRRLTCDSAYKDQVSLSLNYAIDYYSPKASPFKLFRTYLFEHYGLPSSAIKFCQFTGLHPATLSEIENGKVDWPNTGLAFKEVLINLRLNDDQIAILGRAHDNYYLSLG